MAAKRTATSDLNHDNWDREETPEDAGTFQRASNESLKQRVIKTAKRRNPISSVRESEDSEKKSAFAGFTGFTKTISPTNTTFSFLSSNSTEKTEQNKINGFQQKPENPPENNETTSGKSILLSTAAPTQKKPEKSDDYYSKLKGLNESVSKWIKQHVDANPFINLQPIFKDYEKYFKDLENGKEVNENKTNATENTKEEAVSSMSNFVFKAVETVPDSTTGKLQSEKKNSLNSKSKFSFGTSSTVATTTKPSFGFSSSPATSSFSFGGATTSSTSVTTQVITGSIFSFGSGSTATVPSFSFSNSSTPSFSTPKAATSTEDINKEDAAANDEPPKVEFTPVIEKDYLYTTRCKMFVKKEKEFTDGGVGNLYIKSIENSEKVQVILRADTNLGNLLCNFILSEGIPLSRVGKKDVMLVCLPTPDSKPPPVPVLLRVKSSEEADTLFETFTKYKK